MGRRFAVHGAVLACLLGLGWPTWAEDPSINTMMKERLDARKAQQAIEAEGRNANATLQAESQGVSTVYYDLKSPAPNDARLAQLQQNVEQLSRREADLKAELAALPANLAAAKKQLEAAGIKDPAERTAKAKELETQLQELNKKLNEASAPYQKRVKDLNAELNKTEPAFEAALTKCFKNGTDKFADAKVGKLGWYAGATNGSIQWTVEGKDGARVALFLQDMPFEKPTSPQAKLIDGKYGYSFSGTQMWVMLNYFQISLTVSKKEWQGDEAATITLVKNLVDLDGLAAFKP